MIVYARICTYLYVYSNMIRLYGHIRTEIVYVRICMYVYVYDVYARTMHVYACIFSYDPLKHGSWCQIPKTHSLWMAASGPHSGHPRASEHSFFSVIGETFAHPILHTHTPLPPREHVPGPFCTPHALQGRPPCHIQAWWSSLMAHNGRSRRHDFTLLPENVGRFPSKTPPDSDLA